MFVEAVPRFVGRQQRPSVDLQSQQIADRMAVLGPVEPMDGRRARIGVSRAPRSSAVTSHDASASYAAGSGLGRPGGGIARARSFRTTFSHASTSSSMYPTRSRSMP